MLAQLEELRRRREGLAGENLAFSRYVHSHHMPEEPFRILTSAAEREIDCTQCANCCREVEVDVSDADISAIAVHLNITPASVVRHYTREDALGHRVLRQEADTCVFLDGNLCIIYDARPKACREFPHVSGHTSASRFESLCRRASVCPIVYTALERFKHLVGCHHRA